MESPITCALCESFGLYDANFLQNTDESKKSHARIHFMQSKALDDGIMVDDVLKWCFISRQPKVERPISRIECRHSLLELCHSLLKQRPKNPTASCNICGTAVSISRKKQYNIIHHSNAHLEVKLFTCRHCSCSSSTSWTIRSHVRRVHSIKNPTDEDFEDKSVEYFVDISEQMKRCFSISFPRASALQRQFIFRTGSREISQRSVNHLCYSIYIQRSKPASLECNLCGLRISIQESKQRSLKASSMFNHAAAHLEVKLFTCRHCDLSLSTNVTMKRHLRYSHKILEGNSDDFDDRSRKFHSEYMDMIERCFSAGQIKPPEVTCSKDNKKIKAEANIRSQATGSKLAVERQLSYNRLIRKLVGPDGRVKCSLCSKRILVKIVCGINQHGISHVETHLQKPLYRCKVCARRFNTRPAISGHLKRTHALGMGKNYECFADEFHEEIMTTFAKCFSVEGS